MSNMIAAAGQIAKAHGTGGWNVILDIAKLVSASFWPGALLAIVWIYRKEIPGLFKSIASRLSKLEFGGVSIELAKAKAFAPDWSAGALDLRQKAAAIQVTDSTAMTFVAQLKEEGDADYAEVNLGNGKEWLTSRLFIMAIVFARMKGIKCFVFVETSGNLRKRFVCCAKPEKIRWAFAKHFAWLEQAYAGAYSNVLTLTPQAFVVTNDGRLGNQFSQADPKPSIQLLQTFLANIQAPSTAPPAPNDLQNWVLVDDPPPTYEHAVWLTSELLEGLLGKNCSRSGISLAEIRSRSTTELLKTFLSMPDRFIAVTSEDQRFEYLVDRSVILEQVSKQIAAQNESPS
jgi:hypothetical protein